MSKKLWEKGYEINKLVEEFTVGNDYKIDMNLITYDIEASIAHAEMLHKMGYLLDNELKKIKDALKKLMKLVENREFEIKLEDEDCHTAIENFLVDEIGEPGKKIHTARSRNDQVLTALRLFYKSEIRNIEKFIKQLQKSIREFSKRYGSIKFAAFTHTRKAMPTSFKIWCGALVDSLKDDLKLLRIVYQIIDQSPLGTGAGYGIPIEIDRKFVAQKLGFSKVQNNPIYAQNSREKFDYLIAHMLSQISYDLNKFSSDIIFFSLPEIGYLTLPRELCTGSSIMPHKLNPDLLELIRGYHHRLVTNSLGCVMTASNLISGYHRDFQLTKYVMIENFEILKKTLKIMAIVFEKMRVNGKKCNESINDEVLSTEEVYKLVRNGIPFRDAYRKVSKKYARGDQN